MITAHEKEWYAGYRGIRLGWSLAMNVTVLLVWIKTDSILWAFIFCFALNAIRKAPLLWELDRIERELKPEQQVVPSGRTRAAAQ